MNNPIKIDINPALRDLKVLVGEWTMELSNASFLSDQKATLQGNASFTWFDNGDFLILRQGKKNSTELWATWFIGKDEGSPNYTVLYIDNKQSSRRYEMSFENDILKIWRNGPEFIQRFVGKLSADKNTITGYWENAFDKKRSEHDFDLVYKRVK